MQNKLRIWLYYRLSRDEDKELNSLNNQRSILMDYAKQHGYEVVGESFDDNVSGMHFQRQGIDKLQEAAEKHLMDAVLVKDLSRLGRHKTMTAVFIDVLRQYKVKVISVTENIDTSNENDELIIGFKQLLNDQYARDISRKIRWGFKQKQKEGIVIIPPFGYKKDKNTQEIEVIEECAEIVRLIFKLYIDGMGVRKIAKYLNEKGYKSPAYYQKAHYNKSVPYNKTKIGKQYIWSDLGVTHVLINEAYIGTLICGKTSKSTIYKTREYTSEDQQVRHENYFTPIISNEMWELVCAIRKHRTTSPIRAGNQKVHRYAGFLKCVDCGGSFTSKKRSFDNIEYVEYICTTYNKHGSKYCSSHRIREEDLDDLLYGEMAKLKDIAVENLQKVDEFIKVWTNQRNDYEQMIGKFQMQLVELEENIKSLILEKMKAPQRTGYIEEIINDCENQMVTIKENIEKLKTSDSIGKNAKLNIKSSVEILEQIIDEKSIDNAHLHMVLSNVSISQPDSENVNLEFELKTPLKAHVDMHDHIIKEIAMAATDKNKINGLKAS
jgi:DNA invertase Pin-like site-specific DNA recombinase